MKWAAIKMEFRDHINLIPRNNSGYGFKALFGSLAGVYINAPQAPNTEDLFHQNPIWTKSGRTSLYAILKALDLLAGAKVGVPLFCCINTKLDISPRMEG